MKIELPNKLSDCRPEQLSKWMLLTSGEIKLNDLLQKLDFRVQVVSIFSGVSKDRLNQVGYRDINKMFNHCINMLSGYAEQEPKEEMLINGEVYEFNKDIGSYESGRVIDMKLVEDVYSNPHQVLAILYTKKGLKYNETDDRNRVIDPMDKRAELFRTEFPGDEFLNVFAFFLRTYEDLNTAMSVLNLMKMKEVQMTMKKSLKKIKRQKIMNGMIGRLTFWRYRKG